MNLKSKIVHRAFAVFLLLSVFVSSNMVLSNELNLIEIEKKRVLESAEKYLNETPVTITSFPSPRSAGGIHDFSSEGDYWWPDTTNPEGPYIQRDGETNPNNFVAHRQALLRFSVQASALATAYVITHDEKYARHAILHMKAWFLDTLTHMSPHLKYAQAIKGKVTGRGTGIIDTIHLIEIAKAIEALETSSSWTPDEIARVKQWFSTYLEWMTTHEYGIAERDTKNNHAACWVFQVAAYAELVGDTAKMQFCRNRFKEVLLPNQLAEDGSFPLELKRTKPYCYSLFNLEAFAGICQILSTKDDNLWNFILSDGRNMKKAMEFMFPYIQDKSLWKYPPDVMYYQYWPMRQASLLFSGIVFNEQKYLALWQTLNPDPPVEEIIRNYPIRQPLLWLK